MGSEGHPKGKELECPPMTTRECTPGSSTQGTTGGEQVQTEGVCGASQAGIRRGLQACDRSHILTDVFVLCVKTSMHKNKCV